MMNGHMQTGFRLSAALCSFFLGRVDLVGHGYALEFILRAPPRLDLQPSGPLFGQITDGGIRVGRRHPLENIHGVRIARIDQLVDGGAPFCGIGCLKLCD